MPVFAFSHKLACLFAYRYVLATVHRWLGTWMLEQAAQGPDGMNGASKGNKHTAVEDWLSTNINPLRTFAEMSRHDKVALAFRHLDRDCSGCVLSVCLSVCVCVWVCVLLRCVILIHTERCLLCTTYSRKWDPLGSSR